MNWELHGSDGHFEIQDMDESRRVALVRFASLEEARAMTAARELLAIVKHLGEMFEDGADKVYRNSIAIGDDDRTLEDYVLAALDKVAGKRI